VLQKLQRKIKTEIWGSRGEGGWTSATLCSRRGGKGACLRWRVGWSSPRSSSAVELARPAVHKRQRCEAREWTEDGWGEVEGDRAGGHRRTSADREERSRSYPGRQSICLGRRLGLGFCSGGEELVRTPRQYQADVEPRRWRFGRRSW
jgi:hypothetical protein